MTRLYKKSIQHFLLSISDRMRHDWKDDTNIHSNSSYSSKYVISISWIEKLRNTCFVCDSCFINRTVNEMIRKFQLQKFRIIHWIDMIIFWNSNSQKAIDVKVCVTFLHLKAILNSLHVKGRDHPIISYDRITTSYAP